MARARPLTATNIIAAAFLSQLAGHLLLKAYTPNVAAGAVGFLLIVLIYFYTLFIRRDPFGFILIVYINSHFSYADNQGGLWNLLTFGLLGMHLVVGRQRKRFRQPDLLIFVLLAVFILWNVLGWFLKNPMPIVGKIQGIAVLVGFVLMFNLTRNMVITAERFRLFLVVSLFMLLYQVVVAMNQRYYLIDWNTPLIGGYSEQGTTIIDGIANATGTLGHFELFGEYAVLLTCLLVPLLSSSAIQRQLDFAGNRVIVMIFACFTIVMLTSTRAAAILLVFVLVAYYLLLPARIFSAIDRVGRQFKLIVLLLLVLPVAGTYFGMSSLMSDFSDLSGVKFTAESVISGAAINRGSLTTLALERIENESWWVGYGFGVPRSNGWAWFNADPARVKSSIADFHNLYLSLPMLYGWVGSMAFLALIVVTESRLVMVSFKYRRKKTFLIVLAVGFSLFWACFLLDEFKISILRNPNYHMMFWIWLGLSSSVVRTIRFGGNEVFSPSQSDVDGEGGRRH